MGDGTVARRFHDHGDMRGMIPKYSVMMMPKTLGIWHPVAHWDRYFKFEDKAQNRLTRQHGSMGCVLWPCNRARAIGRG